MPLVVDPGLLLLVAIGLDLVCCIVGNMLSFIISMEVSMWVLSNVDMMTRSDTLSWYRLYCSLQKLFN